MDLTFLIKLKVKLAYLFGFLQAFQKIHEMLMRMFVDFVNIFSDAYTHSTSRLNGRCAR